MALPAFLPQKVGFPERSVHSSAHLVAFLPVDRIPCHEDNIIARNDRNAEKTIRFSHQATRPISLHAVSHFFAGNKSHSRLGKSVLFIQNDDKSAYPGFSLLINRFEVSLIAQYVLFDHLIFFPAERPERSYTVSFFLPLALLLLRTFLPEADAILFLNPCSLSLCLFFGWYVLFILRSPSASCCAILFLRSCLLNSKGIDIKILYVFRQNMSTDTAFSKLFSAKKVFFFFRTPRRTQHFVEENIY